MDNDIVKITNAAYRLLDYLPDSDPLKNKAKEKVLAILEYARAEDITILQNYLELVKSQGWIDSMNFLIIKKQYDQLKQEIIVRNQPVKKVEMQVPAKPIEPLRVKSKRTETITVDYSLRQKSILQLLQVQEKVQVADIIKKIPSVTKRTVRRDLDDLLKKKAIVRMGEFNQVFYRRVGT